jgi:DNA-binding CsgD family transcriptional regulator
MPGAFEPIGLSEVDEQIYLALIEAPGSTLADLTRATGVPARQVRAAASRLVARRLVGRQMGTTSCYLALPPEVGVEALILERQEQLGRVRLEMNRLIERARARDASPRVSGSVEILETAEDLVRRFSFLQSSAEHEIVGFDRPPYGGDPLEPIDPAVTNPVEKRMLSSGLHYRIVYDHGALETPGVIGAIEAFVARGEEARIYPELPTKLAIFDSRIAMVPHDLRTADTHALVLSSPTIVSSLLALFELIWKAATPYGLTPTPDAERHLTDDQLRLLRALAAGVKDEAIARQLGVSLSTVERRIRSLMRELGARTRFQAGLRAREQGWL